MLYVLFTSIISPIIVGIVLTIFKNWFDKHK
ncbi:type I toxin-antitoxin system Fst family toxin [Apilactobacillus micheneri]|nr:type I toxin-antitoxin system Fst family toxin [Apilactobacillus micheneri]TPR49852.1 type I toxin-antitoxin system Fst family toxin [Apilactobacillus micheneri]